MRSFRPRSTAIALALFALGVGCRSGAGAARTTLVSWSAPARVDSGGGHRGPWRMNDSEYDYVDDPTIAVAPSGDIAVAWVNQAKKDVLFQSFDRARKPRLAAPVNVSKSPSTFSWLPRIVLTGGGERGVALLWQEIVFSGGSHGGEISFARSSDGGRSFSAPINLSESSAGDGKGRLTREQWDNGSLDLAVGPRGELYAAWTEYQGALWLARSSDSGATFSRPIRVSGSDELPARGPSLGVAADGTVHLAWTVGEDPAADIQWASSRDGGKSFSQPEVAWPSPGHSDAPKLAVDGRGEVHLVFAEREAGRARIYYARRSSRGGGFDARPLFEPEDELADARYPALALDAQGRIYVAWENHPEPEGRPRGIAFSMSRDGGRTFAPPTIVPGTTGQDGVVNGGQQGLLTRKLWVSASGLIGVAHSSYRPDHSSDIWLITGVAR